tara:strand:- start:806 stop:1150 length:345 start_codon:yes stop_codon:yes gene_type:complete
MRKIGLVNCEGNIIEYYLNSRKEVLLRTMLKDGNMLEFKPPTKALLKYLSNEISLIDITKNVERFILRICRGEKYILQSIDKNQLKLAEKKIQENHQNVCQNNIDDLKLVLINN